MRATFQALLLFCVSASAVAAPFWTLSENFVGVSIADADWTIDESFPGTKIIFDGRYTLKRDQVNNPAGGLVRGRENTDPADRLIGMIDAHLQWGEGETGLEYAIVSVAPIAFERFYAPTAGFSVAHDTWEWGVVRVGFDDPLGIDSYAEFDIVRASRTWAYKRTAQSSWTIEYGVKGSAGFAFAESIVPEYEDVSNPAYGIYAQLRIKHDRFGEIYTDDRIVTGFTFGSPATNSSTSREARIRFGYLNQFYRCLTADVFFEKRSFNFADPVLTDLYTKSKRVGAQLGCSF
jgi:hypothetical protein